MMPKAQGRDKDERQERATARLGGLELARLAELKRLEDLRRERLEELRMAGFEGMERMIQDLRRATRESLDQAERAMEGLKRMEQPEELQEGPLGRLRAQEAELYNLLTQDLRATDNLEELYNSMQENIAQLARDNLLALNELLHASLATYDDEVPARAETGAIAAFKDVLRPTAHRKVIGHLEVVGGTVGTAGGAGLLGVIVAPGEYAGLGFVLGAFVGVGVALLRFWQIGQIGQHASEP